jgi:hypothetical protein
MAQKYLLSSQKYGFGIGDQEKTYPGSGSRGKKVLYPGPGSATSVAEPELGSGIKGLFDP